MYIKSIIIGLVALLSTSAVHALLPPNIIASCQSEAPYDRNITISKISVGGFSKSNDINCEDQYTINSDGKVLGFVICNDIGYILIDNKKIRADSAVNMSIHQGIKPGYLIPDASNWLKINDGKNDYLCISGPISEAGFGALHEQYYIIENVLNSEQLKAYFLFFDKPGSSNLLQQNIK